MENPRGTKWKINPGKPMKKCLYINITAINKNPREKRRLETILQDWFPLPAAGYYSHSPIQRYEIILISRWNWRYGTQTSTSGLLSMGWRFLYWRNSVITPGKKLLVIFNMLGL